MSNEQAVARHFIRDSAIQSIQAHGHGLINDTYLVTDAAGQRIILQRINRGVFPRPEWIMENLRVITDHVRQRSAGRAPKLRLPSILPARDGTDWVHDTDGDIWRAQEYLEGTVTLETILDLRQAFETGSALGRFHAALHDLDPGRLHQTLAKFHDTPSYFAQLLRVAARPQARLADRELRRALAFVRERQGITRVLQQAQRTGKLKLRVVHGDTKLNNFLFDAKTGAAVSLIDLDTVQPGLIHFDIGDCLRSCANPAGETPADPDAARFDGDIARAILQGYFTQARHTLSGQDCDYLYDSVRLIPFELGLRFLVDHLQGDLYFKIDRPGRNLERALTQFRVVASIEQQEPVLRRQIAELASA